MRERAGNKTPRWAAYVTALAAAAALSSVLVSPAAAVVVRGAHGQFFGVTPHTNVNPASLPGALRSKRARAANRGSATVPGQLEYNPMPPAPSAPGLVLHSSAPYLVFWDPANQISATSRATFRRYFTDLAADSGKSASVFAVNRQFTDGSGFADYRQTFNAASQVINDGQPYPAQDLVNCPPTRTAAAYPTCITDLQLQSELTRLIAGSHLPTGVGANAPIYFVVTPPSVNVCQPASVTPPTNACADNIFCAYHSGYVAGSGVVLYSPVPLLPLGTAPKLCQSDGNAQVQTPNDPSHADLTDVALKYVSHEHSETVTDPLGTGWWDSASGNEDGDNCNFHGSTVDPVNGSNPNAFAPTLGGDASAGTLYDQLVNGHPYYVQSEWSNGDQNCQLQPSPGAISAAFTAPAAPAPPGTTINFDPTASASARGLSSVTWNFGDGSAPAFSVGAALPPTAHTFATLGVFAVSLTLVDTAGNLSTATHIVTIGTPPTASIRLSTAVPGAGVPVTFDGRGSRSNNSGQSISTYTWSFGDGTPLGSGATPSHTYASTGTYTVTLTVADGAGLTATTTRQVTVDEAPVPALSIRTRTPASGLPVQFSGSASRDSDGSIRSFRWDFGDGSAARYGAAQSHAYRQPGYYVARLTVTDSGGVSASAVRLIKVALAGRVTSVSVLRNHGGTFLVIRLNAPGTLSVDSTHVRINRAGTATIRLTVTGVLRAALLSNGSVAIRVRLTFVPAAGVPFRHSYVVTIRR